MTLKMSRFDYNLGGIKNTFFLNELNRPLSEIHDFNTGDDSLSHSNTMLDSMKQYYHVIRTQVSLISLTTTEETVQSSVSMSLATLMSTHLAIIK